jgi:hypothetical protein
VSQEQKERVLMDDEQGDVHLSTTGSELARCLHLTKQRIQ